MKVLFIDAIPSKVKIHTQHDTVTKVTTEVLFLSNKNIMSVSCFIITYNTNYIFPWIFSNTDLIIHWFIIFFLLQFQANNQNQMNVICERMCLRSV